MFVKFNSKLRNKRGNKDRDPLVKEVDDVMADDDNEFITGIVPPSSEIEEQCAPPASSLGPQAKRKRPRHPKKKVRSLQSLMRDVAVQPATSSSDSEDEDGDIAMHFSDSDDDNIDKSPLISDSDD